MSLGKHLAEFQKRVFLCLFAILITSVAGWFLAPMVMEALREPLLTVMSQTGRQTQINYSDISSPLNVRMNITFTLGIIIAAPFWLYQVWAFLAPGLKHNEKLYGIAFVGSAVPLFVTGAIFGWSAFPNLVRFMSSFASPDDVQLISADTYLKFVMNLMLFMGVGFVLPLLLVLLNFIGVLSAKSIIKGWRIAIVIALIFAAFITPPTDILSMFLLSSPMLALYLTAWMISLLHERRAAKREAKRATAEAARDAASPAGAA